MQHAQLHSGGGGLICCATSPVTSAQIIALAELPAAEVRWTAICWLLCHGWHVGSALQLATPLPDRIGEKIMKNNRFWRNILQGPGASQQEGSCFEDIG